MLQVHRLATLFCKFYILASSLHRLTYKGTHRLYILRLKASIYVQEHFLIPLLPIILNRFCSVFQFRLYIRDCLAGQYILFQWTYCQNSLARVKALEIRCYWCSRKLERHYIHCNVTQQIVSTTCVFEYRLRYRISSCL